jgi:predicted CXXCH cytochrome family protein
VAINSDPGDRGEIKVKPEIAGPTSPTLAPLKRVIVANRESPFLNTRLDAKYVGSAACRECHAQHAESFSHSAMGRSMAEIDLQREPPDAAFAHALSKRRYEVRRKDGTMWHRELLTSGTAPQEEVLLAEFPVKYVVGSGHHSLTYLVESDGFLMESPITWYRSTGTWGMSPGYDQAQQIGFQRETGQSCLVCHAGRSRALGGSMHKMEITEAGISCERCHGPGSLHVNRHKAKEPLAAEEVDHTIVNPAHLSRELAEAVCQQCHLSGAAGIVPRERRLEDYRPGLPLQDFRHDFGLANNADMTVVGHVEQMHHSRCYQKSSEFTCTTCHSPHNEPAPESKVAHFREICLKCHEEASCKVDPVRREKESASNDCVHCHMPQSKTDIPHLAFTHHRVGIHNAQEAKSTDEGNSANEQVGGGTLAPILELKDASPVDKKVSLGLAYLEASNRETYAKWRRDFEEQGLTLLTEVRATGLEDGMVDSGLARIRFRLNLPNSGAAAEAALQDPSLSVEFRCYCLFILADQYHRQGRDEDAVGLLKQLAELRRDAAQWQLRAECEKALGNQTAMEEALQAAIRIDPRLWQVHQTLAEIYKRKGDKERAEYHAKRAVK